LPDKEVQTTIHKLQALGWTQQRIADRVHCHRVTISKLSNGSGKETGLSILPALCILLAEVERPTPKQPAPKQPAPKQPAPKQPAPKQPAQKGLLQIFTKSVASPPIYTMPPVQPRQSPPKQAPPLPKYTPPVQPTQALFIPYPDDWFSDEMTPLEVTENQPTIQTERKRPGWEDVWR
jgi:transcriptional regulator with XRE-family HTH domain